jgi:hypothetical protein
MRKLMAITTLAAACALGSLSSQTPIVAAQETFSFACFPEEYPPELGLSEGSSVVRIEAVDKQAARGAIDGAKEFAKSIEQTFGVTVNCGEVG